MIIKTHRLVLAAVLLPFACTANAEVLEPSLISGSTSNATRNSLQLGYSLDRYSRTFDDNPIATLQYGRQASWGSVLLRTNSSNRYQSYDTQYEVDLYPQLWKGSYAYLNIGTSSGNLFSLNSQGAEIFSSFSNGFEGSLGARHLAFTNSSVTMYTGSISKYAGNYLFTFRPYITPSNAGTSVSANIKLTKYFSDADEYLRISASAGISPEEQAFPPNVVILRSRSFGVTGQWSPRKAVYVSPSFSHARQELLFAPGQYVGIDTFAATVSYRF